MTMLRTFVESVRKQLNTRFVNPDPVRSIELGAYGRMQDGAFLRAGNITEWAQKAGVQGVYIEPLRSSTTEDSTQCSHGTKILATDLNVDVQAVTIGAKIGLSVEFTQEHHFYMRHPSMHWTGIKNLDELSKRLVEQAWVRHNNSHDPRGWNQDNIVITSIYTAKSLVRFLSATNKDKVKFTVAGAAEMGALSIPTAEFKILNESSSQVALAQSFVSPDADMTVYYEAQRVNYCGITAKWWGPVRELNGDGAGCFG